MQKALMKIKEISNVDEITEDTSEMVPKEEIRQNGENENQGQDSQRNVSGD